MSLHFLFLLALLCPALALAKPSSKSEYCYSTHENPYLFFSTKTAYDYNHGDLNEDQVPASKFATPFFARANSVQQLAPQSNFGAWFDTELDIQAIQKLRNSQSWKVC